MDYNGLQWTTMGYNGLQRTTMDYNGLHWTTMDYKELQLQCFEVLQKTSQYYNMGLKRTSI